MMYRPTRDRHRRIAAGRPIARLSRLRWLLRLTWPLVAVSATAQTRDLEPDIPVAVVDSSAIVTPVTDAGRIGERQTREDVAREAGIKPMGRINDRVGNRVQSRLRTRLDRNYSNQPGLR
ncbi:hypothetical protein [Sphingomonas sp. 179-A 2A2 NHS]|uniref:hypothetical protein n=1 Tax=Sphingomonas sp. 179-A 2A2 NHS TaxID=3374290 RepID=UPI003879511B